MSRKGFYSTTAAGQTVCRICNANQGTPHDADCPVAVLRQQLSDVTGQLGLFIATMQEMLDLFRQIDPKRDS